MPCGVSNSPGPLPCLPHAVMNVPSLENLTMRSLVPASWTSATQIFAVGRDHDRATRTQIAGTVAGHSRLAQNHQYLAVGGKLDEIGTLAVPGDLVAAPHIALAVYIETVRNREHVRADRLLKFARRIELLHRRERRIRAFGRAATVEDPDALAIAVIDLDFDGCSEFPTLG